MKKIFIYGLPFVFVMIILYSKNLTIKVSILPALASSDNIISNKWRIKRQLSNNNLILHDNDIRFTNANESKNASHSEVSLDKKRDLIKRFKKLWPVASWRSLGFFTDDYLFLINEHWLQFPPHSEVVYKCLGSIYIIFATAGGWGNIIVLFMYFR